MGIGQAMLVGTNMSRRALTRCLRSMPAAFGADPKMAISQPSCMILVRGWLSVLMSSKVRAVQHLTSPLKTNRSGADAVQEKADEEETTDPVQRLAEESEKQQAQEEEEDTTMDIAEGKPLYDFRRVLHRLPRLAKHDHLQAERLLLGLHERFWHAGVGDMTNLLIRAGMPK